MSRILIAASLLAFSALPASGQIAWDSPPLVSPVVPSGVSLFLIEPAGGDLGGMLTYRHAAGPVGLGYRIAIAEDNSGDVAVAGGIDVSGFLARGVDNSGIDVMWWSGGGLGVGDETVVTIPFGALAGWSGGDGDAVISPYAGGHLALDIITGEGDNLDLSGAFDVGIDVRFSTGWLLRFGGSFGDRDALAIGLRVGT